MQHSRSDKKSAPSTAIDQEASPNYDLASDQQSNPVNRDISRPHTSLAEHTIDSAYGDTETSNSEDNETQDSERTGEQQTTERNSQKSPQENLNELLQQVGGVGRFQYLTLIVVQGGIASVGYWIFALGYLTQKPVYQCTFAQEFTDEEQSQLCQAENICASDPLILNWSVDHDSPKSLNNWQQRLDLMCTPEWKVGGLGTVFFIGWASSLLWLPRFGDKVGRQKCFAVGMSLNLAMFTMMMWTSSLDLMLVSSFIQGCLTSLRINVGYLYMLELMPKESQTKIGTGCGVFDACTYLLCTLYFMTVSKDWFYFVLVGYLLNVISVVGAWFMPESPIYLCEKGQLYELERSMKVIAKINGKDLIFDQELYKTKSVTRTGSENMQTSSQEANTSTCFFLSQCSILINLLIMMTVWLITSFNFYLIQFLINTFDQVYTTAIFSSVSEICGIIAGGFLFQRYGVKGSLFASFCFALSGSLLLLLYGLDNEDSALFPVLVLVAKFGIASSFNIIYVAHNKVFPVLFAATAFGICNFITRIFTSLSPILAQMEEPTPILVFFFLSLLGVTVVWGIQTGEVPPQKHASPRSEVFNPVGAVSKTLSNGLERDQNQVKSTDQHTKEKPQQVWLSYA